MKTAIEGIYKGIKEVKAGSFINEKGQKVNYNQSYKLVFDQIFNSIPKECSLKVPKELALNTMPLLKPYDKFVINIDITIYDNNNISVVVCSVEKK